MTPDECRNLEPGAIVLLWWPGSSSGVDTKRARVVRVNTDGTKVATNVAMVNTKGEYSGRYGASVRWFGHDEIRCSDED
jgi:hypothetical protein